AGDPPPTPTTAASVENSDTTGGGEDGRKTIRFAVYDFEQGRYQGLIEAFEEDNPEIEIKLVSIDEVLGMGPVGREWPDDATLKLAAAADVLNTGVTHEATRQGLLLDLTSLIEQDSNFNAADFYPGVLEQYQWDGGAWALPTTVNYELIFFDKDAFDEAGVAYPEAGWSWDDFLTTAKALTKREGDEVTRWGFVEPFPNPLSFIQGRAGPLFDPDADPPTARLDDPAVVEAVQWYANLSLTEEVSPYYPRSDQEGPSIPEGFQAIEDGRAAMWSESFGSWEFRRQQGNLGVVPFPVGEPDDRTTPFSAEGLAISAGTANPDAAWRWIDFLSRQHGDQQGIQIVGLGQMPARRSVAEAGGFWDSQDEELVAALRFAVDHAFTPLADALGFTAFSEAVEEILTEEKSVADALAEAQAAAEEAIEEHLVQEAEATPVPPFTVTGPETETTANEDAVSITFVVAGGPFGLQSFRDLARQFQEAHPDIVVEVATPDFFGDRVGLQEIAADADCFQWFPAFDNEENLAAVLSLEPFFDNDPTIRQDDFFPAVLDQFSAQGQVWGLPGDISVTVIEYNKDLFDAAGLEYPSPDWTTEEFLAAAVALTQGEGENQQYGFVPDLFEPNDMLSMIERMGATLIDDSVDPPAVSFTNPATVEAMRWYTSLTTEYEVKPVFITNMGDPDFTGFEDRQTLIDGGRAAMWTAAGGLGGGGIVFVGGPPEEEEDEGNVGVVPLPAAPDGQQGGGYGSANGYFISASTDARQACWEWIKFLTEQPNAGEGLPARRSVAESAAYRQHVGEERAAAYLASITGATQPGFFQRFSDENSWLSISFVWLARAYDQVLNEGLSVEEALQGVQEIADAYRACVIAREAFTDPEKQQECLQEVDEELPDFFISGGQ
ncbi:MAG: extracellular solute-binding protein, partial [Chloroflexi bacterium]|nr:extracellular solute-binding protein [Chloroflexota bacterium]